MRIALFVTCLADTFYPEVGRATVAVLERLGHDVVFPPDQTCCGQMHANSGYTEGAVALLQGFADAFAEAEVDAIVTPSGSCASMVRHQYPRLAHQTGDCDLKASGRTLAGRVYELSELLVKQLGIEDVGAYFPHRVTYHSACHSARSLRVGDAPLRLLRAVRGIELVELPEAESCCGFGGTFAVKHADVATAMVSDKASAIRSTGAEVCTSLDSSCLMHIDGALSRQRLGVRTMHLAEILACTQGSPT